MRLRLLMFMIGIVFAFSFIISLSSLFVMNATISIAKNDHLDHRDDKPLSPESNFTYELLRYFGYNDTTNVGVITWAHAVNSQQLFREALDDKLDFLEADVLLRHGPKGIPIMAHPPALDSDLSLNDFLEKSYSSPVGVKLDFKTVEALRGAVDVLTAYSERRMKLDASQKCPFWMNADIVSHGTVDRAKVDAEEFLATALRVTPDATLSVGWNIHADHFRVGYDKSSTTGLTNAYSDDDVKRMRDALARGVSPTQSITFAVWAKFIAGSNETLKWLTHQFPGSSLTIWGKEGDATVDELKSVYTILPNSRVFLDLPDSLRRMLLSCDGSKVGTGRIEIRL